MASDSDPASSTPTQQATNDVNTRVRLAFWVAFGGMGAVCLLGAVAIYNDPTEAKNILTMVLPVIGTWVGTVLAFYFAKDNLLAATQSTKELLGLDDRLRKIPVEDAMLKFSNDKVLRKKLAAGEDEQTLKLVELSEMMRTAGRNRLPVVKADGAAQFIIHLSTLTDFLAQKAAQNPPVAPAIADLTIAHLKSGDADLYDSILKFGCVRRTATLAEAKAVLESKSGNADVFVTENGKDSEALIGWVTNVEIGLRSQA